MRASLNRSMVLRVLGVLGVLVTATSAHAQTRHVTVSLSSGSGLSLGTGQHGSTMRHSPVFLDATFRTWSSAEPDPVLGAVLRVEVDGRASVAIVPRAELTRPMGSIEVRPFVGLPVFFAPFTLLGAEVGVGVSAPLQTKARLFAAFMVDAYFWGSDLPDGQAVISLNFALGLELDVRP